VTQRERWSEEHGTAFHEAGHAVVLYLEDGRCRFEKVSIRREDGSLGRIHLLPDPPGFEPDVDLDASGQLLLEQKAMCAVAGYWAERRWTSRRPGRRRDWLAHIREGAAPDLSEADDLAHRANGIDKVRVERAWLKWIDERVKAQLDDPRTWQLVSLVALELLERKILSGEEFSDVVERSARARSAGACHRR
jgi:hypothetical protein